MSPNKTAPQKEKEEGKKAIPVIPFPAIRYMHCAPVNAHTPVTRGDEKSDRQARSVTCPNRLTCLQSSSALASASSRFSRSGWPGPVYFRICPHRRWSVSADCPSGPCASAHIHWPTQRSPQTAHRARVPLPTSTGQHRDHRRLPIGPVCLCPHPLANTEITADCPSGPCASAHIHWPTQRSPQTAHRARVPLPTSTGQHRDHTTPPPIPSARQQDPPNTDKERNQTLSLCHTPARSPLRHEPLPARPPARPAGYCTYRHLSLSVRG